MNPTVRERARRISALLDARSLSWLNRAIVLEACGSTQDEAFAAAAGTPGLVLSSLRQTKGRGRPGKVWDQRDDLGLAVTFVLDRTTHQPSILPLRAACAICRACEDLVGNCPPNADSFPLFRIKWPNDVVVSNEASSRHAPCRKLAGVLIERRDDLLLLGIGINVLQRPSDWPEPLRSTATSLTLLCQEPPNPDDLLVQLIESLDIYLFADRSEVLRQFEARDIVTGSRRIVEHNNQQFEGVVESIDPEGSIRLRLDSGELVLLPTAASTFVHAEAIC